MNFSFYKYFPRYKVNSYLHILLTFLSIHSLCIAQIKDDSNDLRFLVISDWGGSASVNQKVIAAAMGREAAKINAQFVITCGDNYHDEGIPSENDIRWKTEFEDVYDFPSLQIPWYASLGNHDYCGSANGEIAYSKLSSRWKMPARFYSHKEKISESDSILVVHLDTSPFIEEYREQGSVYSKHVEGQNIKLQLRWLDSLLTVSKTYWTLVVGHHPIYSSAPKHGDTKELINSVLPILKKNKVLLYLSGHDHILQHIKSSEMNFIVCGGGASPRVTA